MVLAAALAGWLAYHFGVAGGGLELNSLNTILLLLCLVILTGPCATSRHAIRGRRRRGWPVVVLYHMYAGVAGVIQFTTVGETLPGAFFA